MFQIYMALFERYKKDKVKKVQGCVGDMVLSQSFPNQKTDHEKARLYCAGKQASLPW
jgi:hypothetical protein